MTTRDDCAAMAGGCDLRNAGLAIEKRNGSRCARAGVGVYSIGGQIDDGAAPRGGDVQWHWAR